MNLKEWENTILKKILAGKGERKKQFTNSSFNIERIYDKSHIENIDYESDIGYPGSFPYTRGIHPTMYRGKFWTMRQYAGFGSAQESNKRYHYLLSQGQTGLSVAFDLPTQIGYDSDNKLAEGEVGKVGVAIDSLEDMEVLFKNIPLDKVSVSMTINATAAIILAMYIAMAEKRNIPLPSLTGTIQNDILKEYIARGTYIFPPKPSLRIISDIVSFCQKKVPQWNTISISGYHIREAGATAVQELAFTFANAIEYVESLNRSGLEINEFAPRLSFFFAAHNNLFEEVAKFRAARKIWARIMKERFSASDRSLLLRFHTQTGGVTLTAQQPMNNIVRVALQSLAGVLGGSQSIHTNSMDEAYALPSEEAVKVALRTQQIIAYESGVADNIDPLAGSYYLEALTKKIEDEVFNYLEKINNMGGVLTAIETAYIQKQIQQSSYSYQKEIDEGKQVVVGVNKFQENLGKSKITTLKVSPEIAKKQKSRLKEIKKKRKSVLVKKSLQKIKRTAENQDNIMVPIIEAVKNHVTLQEISDEMRKVFGEYSENIFI